jgi:hypothetical protein
VTMLIYSAIASLDGKVRHPASADQPAYGQNPDHPCSHCRPPAVPHLPAADRDGGR